MPIIQWCWPDGPARAIWSAIPVTVTAPLRPLVAGRNHLHPAAPHRQLDRLKAFDPSPDGALQNEWRCGPESRTAHLYPFTIYDLPFTEDLMTYHYYKDSKGEWRWRLKAANGRIIADSGEGYKNEQECLADIDRVKASSDAKVV